MMAPRATAAAMRILSAREEPTVVGPGRRVVTCRCGRTLQLAKSCQAWTCAACGQAFQRIGRQR